MPMLPLPDSSNGAAQPAGLLEEIASAMRALGYSSRTILLYTQWTQRFVRFHGLRHPQFLDARHVIRFLRFLAEERGLSASTQNQARAALVFVYNEVLGIPMSRRN